MRSATASLLSRTRLAAARTRRLGLTQEQIAAALGISQSQVSRVLHGSPRRESRVVRAVCEYVERVGQGAVTPELVRRSTPLIEALARVWDGTTAHAEVLAEVISALGPLGEYRSAAERGGAGPR